MVRPPAVRQKTVGFIQHQNRILLACGGKHGGNVFFGFPEIHIQKVRGSPDNERFVDFIGDVPGQFTFSGTGHTVKTECALAAPLESGDDFRNIPIGIEIFETVCRPEGVSGRQPLLPQQGSTVIEGLLDQRNGPRRITVTGNPCHLGGAVELPRRGLLIGRNAFNPCLLRLKTAQMVLGDKTPHTLRRNRKLDGVIEAAQIGRVDMTDTIADPDRRNGIALHRPVDPGFAGGAAAGLFVVSTKQHTEKPKICREHVFDLIKHQEGIAGTGQKLLTQIIGPQPSFSLDRVAAFIGKSDFIQIHAQLRSQRLHVFGFANARFAMKENIDAGFLFLDSIL